MQTSKYPAFFHHLHASTANSSFIFCAFRRLRALRMSTVTFYLFGLIVILIWLLPSIVRSIASNDNWPTTLIAGTFVPFLLFTVTILVVQQVSADSGAEMVQRPARFLLIMLLAMIIGYAVIAIYDKLTGLGIYAWYLEARIFPEYFRYGIFYAPLSWLSCLYLQRAEDEAKFATLTIKRSMLSRDVAQSQLLAARAQIDPKLVERILSKVHGRYQIDADGASELMDHLISYLRLAMNRVREKKSSLATEVAMMRAYFALREAEIDVKVDLQVNFSDKPASSHGESSAPLFLIARKMFETAVSEPVENLIIRIDSPDNSMKVALGIGSASISETGLAHLQMHLTEMPGHARDILHHISESGEHWYAVEIPVEHDIADRIDR